MAAKKKRADKTHALESPSRIKLSDILLKLLPEEARTAIGNRKIRLNLDRGPSFTGRTNIHDNQTFMDRHYDISCPRKKIGTLTIETNLTENSIESITYDLTIGSQRYCS